MIGFPYGPEGAVRSSRGHAILGHEDGEAQGSRRESRK